MAKLIIWTAKDASAWGRLLTIAKEMAAQPTRPAGELMRAVEKAERAVIPTRDQEGQAKVFRLWKFAKTFAAMDEEGRAINAEQLGVHAETAAAIIDTATGKVVSLAERRAATPKAAPERPFRADIDG